MNLLPFCEESDTEQLIDSKLKQAFGNEFVIKVIVVKKQYSVQNHTFFNLLSIDI